jgi:hypothetical protein
MRGEGAYGSVGGLFLRALLRLFPYGTHRALSASVIAARRQETAR